LILARFFGAPDDDDFEKKLQRIFVARETAPRPASA
jgi:hypothetical protein